MKASTLLKVGLGLSALNWLGIAANKLVEFVNGGLMPVIVPICQVFAGRRIDDTHVCASDSTHLRWLADWIIRPNGDAISVLSPSDYMINTAHILFTFAGLVLIALYVFRRVQKS